MLLIDLAARTQGQSAQLAVMFRPLNGPLNLTLSTCCLFSTWSTLRNTSSTVVQDNHQNQLRLPLQMHLRWLLSFSLLFCHILLVLLSKLLLHLSDYSGTNFEAQTAGICRQMAAQEVLVHHHCLKVLTARQHSPGRLCPKHRV